MFKMKGSEEGKVDGSKAAWPTLFPRHHVFDRKEAGPRDPEPHKMAVHEQLTVPARKYKSSPVPVPSSGGMVNPSMNSSIYQSQVQASSYDSRYSYMPMMNVGLYGVGAESTTTSSMNGSSTRSSVVDASTESQRVPWGGENLFRQNFSSGQSKLSTPSRKRKEDDDFEVSTSSSTTQAISQRRSSSNPFQHRQRYSGGETVSSIDDDVNTLNLHYKKMVVCPRDSDDFRMESRTSEDNQERGKDQMIVADQSSEGISNQSSDSLMTLLEQNIFSGPSSQNQSGGLSEPSLRRREGIGETESSIGSMNFRDVVDTFGQQEFWKVQSTIIRQQKFFSKHVFELHRVIEVQHLLAKMPSLSLNYEEALEEEKALEEADNVPMDTSPSADDPEVPEIPEANHNRNLNSGSACRITPYAVNPWAARVLSPLMFAPYQGP